MKQILIFVAGLLLLSACDNVEKNKNLTHQRPAHPGDGVASSADRKKLIEGLGNLRTTIASNKPENIADIFSFPLPDTTVAIWIEDSSFNGQYEKNNNKATRDMFLSFYPDISAAMEIEQINQLFEVMDLNQLLHRDSIEHKAIVNTEPCYRFYEVRIEKQQVTLVAGSASNENYKDKSVGDDEIPANSSELCEHVIFWVFTFNGDKLVVKNIAAAG